MADDLHTADAPPGPGPLGGVRVVELAGIGPGPMAALLLAQLGADVLRIERPSAVGGDPDPLTRGRRSVAVDLKSRAGQNLVLRLVERADVLIEGFRPGVAERLGVGPQQALERNPRLIYGRMTGWGQTGPWAHRAGHDIAYIAITGALGAIGRRGGPPQVPLNLLGDFGGGALYLVVGVLAALHERSASGAGQVVDAAIVDGVSSLAAAIWGRRGQGRWTDVRGTNLLDTGCPYYNVYETADGGWFAVGPLEPQFFAEFMTLLGLPEWIAAQHDETRWPQLRDAIAAAFRARTRAQWEAVFDGRDACAAPVLSWAEAARHPQLQARGSLVDTEDGPFPGPVPQLSRTPGTVGAPPPRPGADGAAALRAWGLADAAELEAAGVVLRPAAQV